MVRKIQCMLLALLVGGLLVCPVFAASAFPDVDENAEYAEAADYLNEIGIMEGDEKGNFNPTKMITRAEMATLVCRMLGEIGNQNVDDSVFSDVPVKHWANGYIAKASSLGIVSGYGDGIFGPQDTVTYEQAVTMIVRTLGYENEANSIGGYPDGYLSIAKDLGLLNKITTEIGAPLDRKSVAIIIYNSYHSYV